MDRLPGKCKTPNFCTQTGSPESWCLDCQAAFEEVAIRSAANMDTPDYFFCGICGRKMTPEDFARHVAIYPKGECSDLEDFHSTKTFTPEEGD